MALSQNANLTKLQHFVNIEKNYDYVNIYARDLGLGTHILDNVLQVMIYTCIKCRYHDKILLTFYFKVYLNHTFFKQFHPEKFLKKCFPQKKCHLAIFFIDDYPI